MVIQGLGKRLVVDYNFPKDGNKRHCLHILYTRQISD